MPLDFPSSPSVNDTYTFSGKTWKWNGEGWQLLASSCSVFSPDTDVLVSFRTRS